jgi:hypothetical protein
MAGVTSQLHCLVYFRNHPCMMSFYLINMLGRELHVTVELGGVTPYKAPQSERNFVFLTIDIL